MTKKIIYLVELTILLSASTGTSHASGDCPPLLGTSHVLGDCPSLLGRSHVSGDCPPLMGTSHVLEDCPPLLGTSPVSGDCPPILWTSHVSGDCPPLLGTSHVSGDCPLLLGTSPVIFAILWLITKSRENARLVHRTPTRGTNWTLPSAPDPFLLALSGTFKKFGRYAILVRRVIFLVDVLISSRALVEWQWLRTAAITFLL